MPGLGLELVRFARYLLGLGPLLGGVSLGVALRVRQVWVSKSKNMVRFARCSRVWQSPQSRTRLLMLVGPLRGASHGNK